jgi:hypothetical protein
MSKMTPAIWSVGGIPFTFSLFANRDATVESESASASALFESILFEDENKMQLERYWGELTNERTEFFPNLAPAVLYEYVYDFDVFNSWKTIPMRVIDDGRILFFGLLNDCELLL